MITITIWALVALPTISAIIVYNFAHSKLDVLIEKIAKLESEIKYLSSEKVRLIAEMNKMSRDHLNAQLGLIDRHSRESVYRMQNQHTDTDTDAVIDRMQSQHTDTK